MGTPTGKAPGTYSVCWADQPPNFTDQQFRVDTGTLLMKGPNNPAHKSCVLSEACTLNV